MPTSGIDQKLIEYINTPMPSYAVLIRGSWGVGKSYYWQQFKNRALPTDKRDITFSAAGLSTLEELERGLFLASIKDFGPGPFQEAGTVVGRALLRWAKVEPDDIKLKADVRPDHTVVCVDDIERFAGEFKVLFGFVLSLLDDANLHVVLIADEDRALTLPGYREYRERIISRSFDVAPAIDECYAETVAGYAQANIREALLGAQSYALALFNQKRLTNLRTVRAILDQTNTTLSGMQWPPGRPASLRKFISAVTFHALAVCKDPSNTALVSRAFRQGDLGMILALHSSGRKKGKLEGGVEEATAMCNLIQSLGFEADAYEWPTSCSFAALAQSHEYDPNALALEFDVFGNTTEEHQPLLVQLRSYRSMTDRQFREAMVKLSAMVESSDFKSLQEMWVAYEILSHLSEQQLVKETPQECRDLFLEIINGYDATGPIDGSLEIWPQARGSIELSVIEALRALEVRVRAEAQKKANEQLQRAIIDGVGDEPQDGCVTPFANERPDEIYARLESTGRPAIYRMLRFLRRRLSILNFAPYTADEVPFSQGLADLIVSKTQPQPGQQLTLDQAALRELGHVLREFIEGVRRTAPKSEETKAGVSS
jgi:hypothetical protein